MTECEKQNLLIEIDSGTRWLKYLREQKYKKVAICGYREFGRMLYNRLKAECFEIPFIVERNYEALEMVETIDTPIIGFKDKEIFVQADIMLLTPDLDYGIIKECMELAGIDLSVISLTDILMES